MRLMKKNSNDVKNLNIKAIFYFFLVIITIFSYHPYIFCTISLSNSASVEEDDDLLWEPENPR